MAKDLQNHQPFEATLQDLVYSVDAGTGLKVIRTVLYCLFVIGLSVIYTGKEFRGLNSEAAMDSAQLARNLAFSRQYVTQCVRPASIAQVSAHTFNGDALIERHPELIRPPMYPAILAAQFKFYDLIGVDLFPSSEAFAGMRIYPAEQWVIVPMHHLFTALTGLMMYLLGKHLFTKKIALIGTTVYFLSDVVWRANLLGTGIPVLAFFSVSAVYFALLATVHRRERKTGFGWMILFGLSILFSAAALLTHYAALSLIIGLALFIFLMGTRRQRSGLLVFSYLVGILAITSPWFMRNIQLSGSPFGMAFHTMLIDTADYPGDKLMRTLNPEYELMKNIEAVKMKWKKNFGGIYENHLTVMGGGLLVAFFFVTYFYRFVRVSVHQLRWGIGLSIILFLIGAAFFSAEAVQAYHIFLPFVILYGLAYFSVLLDRLNITVDLYKSMLFTLVVILSAIPLIFTVFLRAAPGMPYPPYYVPFIMRVNELLRPNEVMCSDMPWATAWYGKRLSILLPQTVEEYFEINDYRKYISGLYITQITKDRPLVSSLLSGPEQSWFPIIMGRTPEGFPLKHGVPFNKHDQVFFTDSARWGGGAPEQGGEAPQQQGGGAAPAAPAAQ